MTYTVRYERHEDGWWTAEVPAVQGCLTQGRTIAQCRRRIREALALFVDDAVARKATLVDDVRLGGGITRVVRRVAAARREADAVQARVQRDTRAAVKELTGRLGLSVRDAAEVLGISYQRVQQLAQGGR
jgi:predicted RNase H-like HicB family nuclease